jgi:hypothetical protein
MSKFDVNVEVSSIPTELCAIMEKYNGDKGSVSGLARHNYTRYYDPLFRPRKDEPLRVFELGIFCGASLRAWRDFFPNAQIVGMDIDPDTMVKEDRIETFCCDEKDKQGVLGWFQHLDKFDVIIDDGLHTFQDNKNFFELVWPMLKRGGVYIVEDLLNVKEYEDFWVFDRSDLQEERLIEIPHLADTTDNNLLMLVKQ